MAIIKTINRQKNKMQKKDQQRESSDDRGERDKDKRGTKFIV